VRTMERAFPDAMVAGHEALIPSMANDPKDRHVLAAAVRGRADVIVTSNVRDFPPAACEPYGGAAARWTRRGGAPRRAEGRL
jgi:hypothetical protein